MRRLLESAISKVEEAAARSDAKAIAKLTPAERERYDGWVARTAAIQAGEAAGDPRLQGTVLQGPAGEVMHGVAKAPKTREAIEDPAAWDERMRVERAARDEVRAPYLAPSRSPVRITRVATRGKTQLTEVCDYLASSGLAGQPELVYGAYRVPDLISAGRLGGEGGGVVEWDIVHAVEGASPPAAAPASLSLAAKDVWVARAVGEPAPLDEDLALDVLTRAGIGPEQTLGIARDVGISHRSSDESQSRIEAVVHGVHAIAAGGAAAALGAAVRGAPWRVDGVPPGVVVDVLQWDAIAQAVHPVRQHRAPLPSPFPYLPLTPQELLRSYLEIVGISPADAYSAQVTHHRSFDLMGRTSAKWGVRRTGGGPDLPCADGKPRKRMAGGHHIVVAYRDQPSYVEGRARFEAYAEGELHAHLRRGLGLREPVPKPAGRLQRTVERVGDVVEFFSGESGMEDGFVPPRYCWPPRGA